MKKSLSIFSLIIFLCLLVGCSRNSDINTTYSTEYLSSIQSTEEIKNPIKDSDEAFVNLDAFSLEDVQEDFDQFVQKYELYHPKYFTDTTLTEAIIEEQRLLLAEGMNEIEFLRVISPIVASFNCGHSGVFVSQSTYQDIWINGRFLAIDVRIINDEIFVFENALDGRIEIGSVIHSINGVSSFDIIDMMKRNISSDGANETSLYNRINGNFRTMFYRYIDASSYHKIVYSYGDSEVLSSIQIDPRTYEEIYNGDQYGEWLPYKSVFEDEYAILDMNSFSVFEEYMMTSYFEVIDNFFQRVEDDGIENIILDLRDNGGGDPMISSYLFRYLAIESQPYFSDSTPNYYPSLKINMPLLEPHFDGELYTIMNGASGSSSGHLLALLKYQNIGVFIGEESGASYVVSDSSRLYNLSHTRIQFNLSSEVWDVAVSGLVKGRGIMPDYEYDLLLSDYLSVKDEILLFTIDLLSNK